MVKTVGNALDDAGHLIANRLGGLGNDLQNIVAQNRGEFRVFEGNIARYIKDNGVSALLKVVPKYGGKSRPIAIEYFVEFSDGVKWPVERFLNP